MEASRNGMKTMKNRTSFAKVDAETRRNVDGELNSKKSVRWSSVGTERNVREPFLTNYSVFSVCVAFGISSALALEDWLGLGLSWPLEGFSRLVVPGFCFGFAFYCLAAYFGEKWTSGSLLALLATSLTLETVMCVLLGRYLPQCVSNFFVFLGFALASAYSSLGAYESALVFASVSLSRFLALVCFASLATAYRPYLGYFFSVLGVLLANYRGRSTTTKDTRVPDGGDYPSNNVKSKPAAISDHLSSTDCFSVAANRRSSLPIIQKPHGNTANPRLLKKAEATLQEMLTSPDVPPQVVTKLQALADLLKLPEAPVVHQRSKSIPLVTLSGGSVFSQRYADFPYTISEDSSYAPQRIRRHYSVVGHCRHSGVWTNNFPLSPDSIHGSSFEDLASEEKSSVDQLDSERRLSKRSTNCVDDFQRTHEEDDEAKADGMVDLDRDRFLLNETTSRKTSTSSHHSSTRSRHISFAEDTTVVDYESPVDHEVGDSVCEDVLEISSELQRLLEVDLLTQWDYPIFELASEAPEMMLSKFAHKIFSDLGLMEAFKIPQKEFVCFFHALERGYHEENPYHNRIHATDVLHAIYYMTTQRIFGFMQVIPDDYSYETSELRMTSLLSKISDNSCYGILGGNFLVLELMAMLTAAAMHDYDHPGRTNAFLIANCHPLAVLYNNRSVLENHHAASAWSLLISNPQHAWLVNLSDAEFKRFRYLVLDEILATDLVRHFDILADFNAKVNEEIGPGLNWTQEEDRLMVSKVILKMADINGPCKNWRLHWLWTERIAEEFYQQGDEERSMQVSVSPYMDRARPQLAKLQESFITHLVAPLCDSLCSAGLLPSYLPENISENGYEAKEAEDDNHRTDVVCTMTKNLQDNHAEWVRLMNIENPDMST